MGSYLKIDPIRLGKFNNAEYTNFMNRTLNQALAAGVEKIGASETLIDGFTANVNKMTDIVAFHPHRATNRFTTCQQVGCRKNRPFGTR